jgi:hypothetical protein
MVERPTVNRIVVGSSPTWGANLERTAKRMFSGPSQDGREAAGSVSDHAVGSIPTWEGISAALGSSRGIKSVYRMGLIVSVSQPGLLTVRQFS